MRSTMHISVFMQVKARKRMQRWPRGNELPSSLASCLLLLGWVLDAQTVVHCWWLMSELAPVLQVIYLALTAFLDSRGSQLLPPPPEAFGQ